MTVADFSSTSDIECLESLTTVPDTHKLICNYKTHRDTKTKENRYICKQ